MSESVPGTLTSLCIGQDQCSLSVPAGAAGLLPAAEVDQDSENDKDDAPRGALHLPRCVFRGKRTMTLLDPKIGPGDRTAVRTDVRGNSPWSLDTRHKKTHGRPLDADPLHYVVVISIHRPCNKRG